MLAVNPVTDAQVVRLVTEVLLVRPGQGQRVLDQKHGQFRGRVGHEFHIDHAPPEGNYPDEAWTRKLSRYTKERRS